MQVVYKKSISDGTSKYHRASYSSKTSYVVMASPPAVRNLNSDSLLTEAKELGVFDLCDVAG